MNSLTNNRIRMHAAGLCIVLTLLFLAGCEPAPIPQAATSTPPPPTAPAAPDAAATAAPEVEAIDALDPEEATAPARLEIPEIGLDVPVVPMGWEVTEVGDQRTTVWVLPEDALGWHPNSAGAGAEGNSVLSGHQLLGDGLLAPLALGEVAVGQEIHLTDGEGRVFVYRVREVSEPQPISDDMAEEETLSAALTDQSGSPRLTLITGWPDFSSTHRIYAVADFVGGLR